MDNSDINRLEKEINLLIKKRNDIQNSCTHKNRYVKFTGNRNEIKQYCSNCNKELGYPDKNDLNEFLNK